VTETVDELVSAPGRGTDAQRLTEQLSRLEAHGVVAVVTTFVDNAGVTRMKAFPLKRLDQVASRGVGTPPCLDSFSLDDAMAALSPAANPDGDLRLVPDLGQLTMLASQPGWAWAPGSRIALDGTPHAGCQRGFLGRMAKAAAAAGLEVRATFEVEFVLGRLDAWPAFEPAVHGPAYGLQQLTHVAAFGRDLVVALAEQGIEVEQFHPEYAPGQFEVSISAADPVAAADRSVLLRHTIRTLAAQHQFSCSFAPSVVAGSVGNGGHAHLSVWREGINQFAGGGRPAGLHPTAEHFMAGILQELPALTTIIAPSASSHLRLVPSHWAGAYRCWGVETREAAIRLVKGLNGTEPDAANMEVKPCDLSANPYLALGALLAAGLAGVDSGLSLPPPVVGDPATKSDDERWAAGIEPLPRSIAAALAHLDRSEVLRAAMSSALFGAFVAVRQAEAERSASQDDDAIVADALWVH
jgi:glutamine synthetase